MLTNPHLKFTLECIKENNRLQLHITSYGKVFSKSMQDRFFTTPNEFLTDAKSSNMELFLVKLVINRYKGSIEIKNRIPMDETQGMHIIVELPSN